MRLSYTRHFNCFRRIDRLAGKIDSTNALSLRHADLKLKGVHALTLNDRAVEEKVKPFRLVKYFTVTSLSLIFLGTILLSMLNNHWARAMQREKSEEYALVIIENLNHQIFLQF